MFFPKFLKKGDTIGVPAPSNGAYDKLHINKYNNAKKKLNKDGYNVILSKNIANSNKVRSGTAKQRANEINEMFKNPDINFIICAAGGEFLVEILPYINWDIIKNNPKFIEGFSDPTGLLFPITTKYDIATIYGKNFGDYGIEDYEKSVEENKEIITGNIIEQNSYDLYQDKRLEGVTGLEGYNLTEKVEWKLVNSSAKRIESNLDLEESNEKDEFAEKSNEKYDDSQNIVGDELNKISITNIEKNNLEIEVTGRIIGGCIDLISEIAGTKYDGISNFNEKYKNDGIIWYFDNCELSKEELIRTLWKLNEFDYFKYTKCVIFGRNGSEISGIGYTMEEALKDSVIGNMNIPIIYDADISHKKPCFTIINGSIATVKYCNGKGSIKQELK